LDYQSLDYQSLLKAALKDLNKAIGRMTEQTIPATPLPRPRIFIFTEKLSWPYIEEQDAKLRFLHFCNMNKPLAYWNSTTTAVERIQQCAGSQPRKILRALRRIQAATAWCEARAEGRKRQAEEILRQQQKAIEILEAEAAMLALK
jgi:hypothetical protein